MLFNSYEFLFLFLPLAVLVYFQLGRLGLIVAAKGWLVTCSLFFYSWWEPKYLVVILFSLLFNYQWSRWINRSKSKTLLGLGIVVNVLLLAVFKYTDFVIENTNWLLGSEIPIQHIVLPLAISFFTFQQIAFLVDIQLGRSSEPNFLNYSLFVTFFPQLIAGPIVHHGEMMPQFAEVRNLQVNYDNISKGLFIFFNGLCKKVVIADYFALAASEGFDTATQLNVVEAWVTSLSYTFQLYFDFSGYTDMAIGIGLLFNIKLPFNFNSPYRALNIQDFWRRWHMTLSRFLKDYIYIPLGGNRRGKAFTYLNLFLVFLIGGIWHGAGWTFVWWGVLHGLAIVLHRFWTRLGLSMPTVFAWLLTFLFVNLAWVFFRAEEWADAIKVLSSMVGLHGAEWTFELINLTVKDNIYGWVIGAFPVVLLIANSNHLQEKFKSNRLYLWMGLFLAVYSILQFSKISEFIYFGF